MSTGTSAGLLESKQAQSVLKHEILQRYVIQFATMTSKRLTPRRAVLVDGFAGRGRFENGSAASAEYLMIDALKIKRHTQVDVFLVEKSREDHARLEAVATEYRARGNRVEVRRGDCQDYFNEIADLATGASLFLFLDPCGANVPVKSLTDLLSGPRASSWPRTELLLNISADLIRRSAGAFLKDSTYRTPTLDTMCGGGWWREVALAAYADSNSWSRAADAVVEEYARRLSAAAGDEYGAAITAVRRRQHHEPVYYLVFLTQNPNGFWVFGEANAKARLKWLEHLADIHPDNDQLALFGPEDPKVTAKEEQLRLKKRVRTNLTAILREHRRIVPVEFWATLLDGVYGEVEEKTVNAVFREAVTSGELVLVAKDSKYHRSTFEKCQAPTGY